MNASESLQMTYSCFLRDDDNRRIVRVSFDRDDIYGKAHAEGILPGGQIEESFGFTAEERDQLSLYLQSHENEILAAAKEISNPMKWL